MPSPVSAVRPPTGPTASRINEQDLLEKAEAGDVSSQFGLAYLYAGGFGLRRPDLERARYWRRRAAFQTTPAQMADQARAYMALQPAEGREELAAWFYEAARSGDRNSAYLRALLLLNVETRKLEGENAMTELACDGHVPAQLVCVNMNLYSQMLEPEAQNSPGQSASDRAFRRDIQRAFNLASENRRKVLEALIPRRAKSGSKLARLFGDIGVAIANDSVQEETAYRLLLRSAGVGNLAAAFFLLTSDQFRLRAWANLDRQKLGALAYEKMTQNHFYAEPVARMLNSRWEFETDGDSSRKAPGLVVN